MAASVNAVVASSGDFYKHRKSGVIVYDGVVQRISGKNFDTLFIDKDSNFHFAYAGEITTREAAEKFVAENNIRFSFGFGPILVDNGEMVKVAKPEPDIFLMAAEIMGVKPEDCTVVEDSTFGIRAAKAAGMRCIAFTGANVHNLDNSEADDRFPEYNDEAFDKYFK